MKQTEVQLDIFSAIATVEATESIYYNEQGEPLPWQTNRSSENEPTDN